MKNIDVVHTKSKGRCAAASRAMPAGHVVMACAPVAAVIYERSRCFDERTFKRFEAKPEDVEVILEADHAMVKRTSGRSALLCRRLIKAIDQKIGISMADLDEMCDNLSLRTKRELEMYEAAAQYVCWSLPSKSRFKHDRAAVVRLLSILASNAFSISNFEFREEGIGFYPAAAVFNHSCAPNCVAAFDQVQLQIRTFRPVAAGEELTIAYTEQARPTWLRQAALWESYKFHCTCSRCCSADNLADVPCVSARCSGSMTIAGTAARRFVDHQHMIEREHQDTETEYELPLPQWAWNIHERQDGSDELRCTTCGATRAGRRQCLRDLQLCDSLFRQAKTASTKHVDRVKLLKRCQKLAREWLRPNGYVMLEILSSLTLAYGSEQDFITASRYADAALPCFYACYPEPQHHPLVAVQHLYAAKLLDMFVEDPNLAPVNQVYRIMQLLTVALPVLQATQPRYEAEVSPTHHAIMELGPQVPDVSVTRPIYHALPGISQL